MSQVRILIVEDDPLIAEALSAHLEHRKFLVTSTCRTGEAAILAAATQKPNLIIMDIMLEGNLDGIEAATIIRERFGTPVIYLTAHAEDEHLQRVMTSDPFGYMLKPLNERELELTIEVSLYRAKMEAELLRNQRHLADAQRIGMLGSWDWDLATNDVLWSDQMFRIYGQDPSEFTPNYDSIMQRMHPDDLQRVENALQLAIANDKHFCLDFRIIRKDGEERFVQAEGEVRHNRHHEAKSMVGTVQDVSTLRNHERELWQLAHHDALTGLPNRSLLYDRMQQAIAHSKRENTQVAVLLLDLDGFKMVNDTEGHETGDLLLVEVSRRLQKCLRDGDTVARLGGDEFSIIASGVHSRADVERICEKLLLTVEPSMMCNGHNAKVTASIGVALFPSHSTDKDELLRMADHAMYDAKHAGKNQFFLYGSEK